MVLKETKKREHLVLLNNTTHEILKNPQNGIKILDSLKKHPRYEEDEAYRLVISSLLAMLLALRNELKIAKKLVSENILDARKISFPGLISYNQNTLGNIYFGYSLYSQALESYLLAVKIEEQEKINVIQICAMTNIAMVFDILDDTSASIKYLKKAYKKIVPTDPSSNHDYSQYIYIICNLLIKLSKSHKGEERDILLNEILKINKNKIDKKALSNIEEAMMHYHVHTGDFLKANQHFDKAREIILKNFGPEFLPRLVKDYAELYYYSNADYKYYIENVEDFVGKNVEIHASFFARLYFILNKYYKSTGDKKKIELSFEKYMYFSEKALEENKADYLNAVDRINENIFFMEENALIKRQNKKLKRLTEELELANSNLELAQNRLNIVTSIGQKIVSSLDLKTIFSMVNKNITHIVALSSFTVFTLNDEGTALESRAFIEQDSEFKNISIPIKARESFNVLAYLRGETIIINNIEDVYKYIGKKKIKFEGTDEINSAMFIPIMLEKRVIGVISLQSDEKNAFSVEYQQFFESLSPFLAIAINNAMRSEKLKEEIESHKLTQQKLQVVNKQLKRLSTLDSLTQIYNRRQFDSMYTKFIKKAEKEGLPLNVCLFDIDNFKNYNDTYGHLEGDKVLVQVAGIIKDHFDKHSSIVARFGGEEFIAVQVGFNEKEILDELNAVRSKIKNLLIVNEESSLGYITISIGVSSNKKVDEYAKSGMMRQADECLYKAKAKGKDQVVQALF